MNAPSLPQQHRWIGIVLLLPFIAWSLSAVFFLIRPGFSEAYEAIPIFQYDLPESIALEIDPDWREVRHFRSVLGHHLIVRGDDGWQHLEFESREPWPLPEAAVLQVLLEDAFQFNPARYGSISSVEGSRAFTDTGVVIDVSWPTLRISQSGRDTRWIDRIYSIHYLQWTGFWLSDRILGLGGLALLIYMTWTGYRMAFRPQGVRRG